MTGEMSSLNIAPHRSTVGGASKNPQCADCGASLSSAYGPACEEDSHNRLTTAGVLEALWTQLVSLDFRLTRTASALTTTPGALTADFIKGRRGAYTHPAKYLLISAAAFILSFRLSLGFSDGLFAGILPGVFDPRTTSSMATLLSVWLYLQVMAVAVVAAPLPRLFSNRRLNYAESLTICMYVCGHAFALQVPLMLGARVLPLLGLMAGVLVLQASYMTWAFARSYGRSRPRDYATGFTGYVIYTAAAAAVWQALVSFFRLQPPVS
jgi:hypothetical protein